ncbi:uncharacterized protein ARMOST_15678 [Armillaria ostoyae]|uniref:Uncharacterized protein n=1 Tax=Armillaria ostoyae TaxID=47428 RepID=A0A284RU63_ARMOS|nr:uncharacterized protein ARMOST_15678 [Armillaria ostoyae]
MPDYYRTTRVEDYGPYLRTAQSSPDLYTSSGAMTRESQEDRCSFLLPDFDDGEFGSGSDTEDRYKRNRFQVFEVLRTLSILETLNDLYRESRPSSNGEDENTAIHSTEVAPPIAA